MKEVERPLRDTGQKAMDDYMESIVWVESPVKKADPAPAEDPPRPETPRA